MALLYSVILNLVQHDGNNIKPISVNQANQVNQWFKTNHANQANHVNQG
jgi:hypothetical protein